MSSNTKSSDFHSNINDKDTTAKKDFEMRQGAEKISNEDKDKHEKTTITFEKKKETQKDQDMRDVHKHEASEGKGIINTIKDKVRDVLGSGDNDKEKDMEKNKDFEKNKYSEHNKNVGISTSGSSDKYSSDLGASSGQKQHTANLGASSGQQHTANLGATASNEKDKDKYSNFGSSSSGQYSAGVGVTTSSDKDKYSSTDKHSTNLAGDKYSSNLASDKYSSSATHPTPATVDRTGLGAEHREVGYDKQANVIPVKNVDMIPNKNVEKDSGHKVDLHASLKTGSAAGSTSGSQASTYKTTESK